MARPKNLPLAEDFQHGTRSRYVSGCRCDPCRAANLQLYRDRRQRGRELLDAMEITPLIVGGKQFCPGVRGRVCPRGARLYASSDRVCGGCRDRLSFNGLVDAKRARAHIFKLSARGIGYRTVAEAASVSLTTAHKIKRGIRKQIRADILRRILEVDVGARADGSLVPAKRVQRMIRVLLGRGFTKAEIAKRLGYERPALQIKNPKVMARTELKVRRLLSIAGPGPARKPRPRTRMCQCSSPLAIRDMCAKCERPLRAEGLAA